MLCSHLEWAVEDDTHLQRTDRVLTFRLKRLHTYSIRRTLSQNGRGLLGSMLLFTTFSVDAQATTG